MRIIHIDSERGFGGGQRQVFFLMRGMRNAGGLLQALVARAGSSIGKRGEDLGLKIFPLAQRNDFDIFSAARLGKICRKFGPDIIFTHSARALSMTWLARKFGFVGNPLRVINVRRVAFPVRGGLSRRKLREGADLHVAISNACRERLIEAGVAPRLIKVIYSGVELPRLVDRSSARKKLLAMTGFTDDNVIVGGSGNLLPVKRFDWLIKAVAAVHTHYPHVRLVIFGDGPCREALVEDIERLKIKKIVRLAGRMETPERFFAGLDIFASTSFAEGLGTSLIDAMARNVALLGPDSTGIPEVISDNVNGLLFDARSCNDLGQKLSLLVSDLRLRRKLAAGNQNVVEKFDIRNTVRAFVELIHGNMEA